MASDTAPLNGGSGKSTTPKTTQNRCYPSDSEAAATGGDGAGSGFYLGPRIGSLCSGYGGLDLGLMAVVGGSVAWHVEYDKHPSAVLDTRFPGVPNYGDVTTTDWTQVEPVDWLTAGYPCQPFSHAGKRKGSADERHLWPAVADAIGVLRPGRVLLENVAGHISLGLDAVLADLAALGYDTTWGVVRAADAGAPHGRARIFIVAADTTGDEGRERHGDDVPARIGRRSPQVVVAYTSRAGWGLPRSPIGGGAPGAGASGGSAGGGQGSATYPDEPRRQGCESAGRRDLLARRADVAADTSGARRAGTEDGRASGRDATARLRGAEPERDSSTRVEWGVYEPAIRRWERILGRPAPRPTEPGRTGGRLNPRFSEWMQGLPDGWVTDILRRSPALKALGNGVVPQQATLAITVLMQRAEVAA